MIITQLYNVYTILNVVSNTLTIGTSLSEIVCYPESDQVKLPFLRTLSFSCSLKRRSGLNEFFRYTFKRQGITSRAKYARDIYLNVTLPNTYVKLLIGPQEKVNLCLIHFVQTT